MARASSAPSKMSETVSDLRRRILDGTWPIHSRIPKEDELMALFGVGKSTVREAVSSLASLGMLEPVKGVGTFVRSLTPTSAMLGDVLSGYSVRHILGYRRALEVEAVQLAAINRTDAQLEMIQRSYSQDSETPASDAGVPVRGEVPGSFHHWVFEAAGNPLLANMYAAAIGAIRAAKAAGELVYGLPLEQRHRDHGAILEAIVARDPAGAAAAMRQHLERDLIIEQPGE